MGTYIIDIILILAIIAVIVLFLVFRHRFKNEERQINSRIDSYNQKEQQLADKGGEA